jgi:hypothetical protein
VRTVIAIVAVVATASALGVVALASDSANGLPSYTNGYAKWPRINAKPFTRCGAAVCPQRRQERVRKQAEGRQVT